MKRIAFALAALVLAAAAQAQLTVKEPWVRATVAHQKATGAFMQLTAASELRVVEVSSPVAGIVEIHEMAMVQDVMKMRAVDTLVLPAGKTVALKPGGYHVMLMDLKGQVKDGDTVPLTLVVQGADGKRQAIEIKAQAKAPNAAPAQGMKH
jgi:copper(I)-binding protein